MSAAAVAIEVLVDVVDEVVYRAIWVLDVLEVGAGVLGKRAGGGVVGTGEEDHLGRGASVADGGDGGLNGVGPFGHVRDCGRLAGVWAVDRIWEGKLTVVRLVHDAHDNVTVAGVLGCQLTPKVGELIVRGPALANDLPVPAGVVVDINDTMSTGRQASLHQFIVLADIGRVKRSANVVVYEELPSNGQAVHV